MRAGKTLVSANLRSGPGVRYGILDKLEPDYPLDVHIIQNGWLSVTAKAKKPRTQDQCGWIDSRIVEILPDHPATPPPLQYFKPDRLLRGPEWIVGAIIAALVLCGVYFWMMF
jgi:hypothetical protein